MEMAESVGRALLFLGLPSIIGIFFLIYRWDKKAKDYIKLLVVRTDGSSYPYFVKKTGGSVTLENPTNKTTKTWAINQFATVDDIYPGVGYLPSWLQKRIKMTIVSEDDWEPMINRNPDKSMIASPAVLGNLLHEKVTEAVITVNKEMLESINNLARRLGKSVSPTLFWLGIGVVVIGIIIVFYYLKGTVDDVSLIKQSLGVQ